MIDYKSSGVDIEAGDAVKARIAEMVRSTYTDYVLTSGGEFAGLIQLQGCDDAIAVSVDGVGTKLKVAVMADVHNTVGQDLVNHCVNDLAVVGCEPFCFVDYIAVGRLNDHVVTQIIEGLCEGCRENGVALIGGETAQMPDMYSEGEYDLAGAIVGRINPAKQFPKDSIAPGDQLIGVASNGLHTNGYSLARKIVFEEKKFAVDTYDESIGCTWGEELLKVHRSYLRLIRELKEMPGVKAFAHITGGGIPGNLSRVIPEYCDAVIEANKIQVNSVFSVLTEYADISFTEAYKVFNMGVGLIIVASSDQADLVVEKANNFDSSYNIGFLDKSEGISRVIFR